MISLIQPSRNNLKYLRWSYHSIRQNAGPDVEICVADDFSSDGTWEWCQELMRVDPNFKAIRNEGPTRLGHTILYDKLIKEVATKDIVGIWHADMYMTPGTVEKIVAAVKPGTVVSLTRVEPPLHPPGPEKVLMDFKTEPEDFDEKSFLEWYSKYQFTAKGKTTEGIFAPWFLYKEDFAAVGGHDALYAPQSKEDSDIFNRFLLKGYQFVQLWDAAIYHMTCRGSRFNPTLTKVGTNSPEWEAQNKRSARNFIRKWGMYVRHDEYLKPVVAPRYNVAFIITNCNQELIQLLEPWCDEMWVDCSYEEYVVKEQQNTKINLAEKFFSIDSGLPKTGVSILFDGTSFVPRHYEDFIQHLPYVIEQTGEVGVFNWDRFIIRISSLETRDMIQPWFRNVF